MQVKTFTGPDIPPGPELGRHPVRLRGGQGVEEGQEQVV